MSGSSDRSAGAGPRRRVTRTRHPVPRAVQPRLAGLAGRRRRHREPRRPPRGGRARLSRSLAAQPPSPPRQMEPRAGGAASRRQFPESAALRGRRRWWSTAGTGRAGWEQHAEHPHRRGEPVPGRADSPLDRAAGGADPARSHRPATSHRRARSERLVTSALWVLIVLQGPAPLLEARVDRSRLPAGEQLTLTVRARSRTAEPVSLTLPALTGLDRKSTRLNSSHSQISYAVFCLKKKKQNKEHEHDGMMPVTDSS